MAFSSWRNRGRALSAVLVLIVLLLATACQTGAASPTSAPPEEPTPTPTEPAVELTLQELIEDIISQVDPGDPDTYAAPEEIVDLGRAAVPTLLGLLDSSDLVTRWAAVYALSRLAEPEDLPGLAPGLEDSNLSNRATIAGIHLRLGDDRGMAILQEAAQSDEILLFSHPPERLSEYAQRILDALAPTASLIDPAGGLGHLAAPPRFPDRDVDVSVSDCTVNVTLNLQFTGAGATEELASEWSDAIEDMWDGAVSSGCCTLDVTVNTKVGGDPDPDYAQVEVEQMENPEARHTSNMTLGSSETEIEGGGRNNNIGGEWDSNDKGRTAAHEAGHAMGIDDEYGADADGKWEPTGDAVGESDGEGAPSIMSQTWDDPEGDEPEVKPRHVDGIMAAYGAECPDECLETWQAEQALGFLFPGAYDVLISIFFDPAGHGPFVGMPGSMRVDVREGSVIISGPAPWVTVSGELGDDGSFTATGQGTVAGFPNIAVTFEGAFSDGSLSGHYTMGASGGLPTGQPIIYTVDGTRV